MRAAARLLDTVPGWLRSRHRAPPLEIPLTRGGRDRFVPLIVTPMSYLAVLALAASMALSGTIDRWQAGLSGALTVQLPAAEADAGGLDVVLDVLRSTEGVQRAEAIDDAAMGRLLAPWLGEDLAPAELPLPVLIDVRVDAPALDLPALRAGLAQIAPAAALDDHSAWLVDLRDQARTVQGLALLVMILVSGAAVATVVFVTSAHLAIHGEVIDILHTLGAGDAYIARQFQWHAFRLALFGAALGFVLAAATLVLAAPDGTVLPDARLGVGQWLVLLLVPPCIGGLACLTARLTVLRALAHRP